MGYFQEIAADPIALCGYIGLLFTAVSVFTGIFSAWRRDKQIETEYPTERALKALLEGMTAQNELLLEQLAGARRDYSDLWSKYAAQGREVAALEARLIELRPRDTSR